MGKRIRVQRRGRGSPKFKASTHKRVAPSRYIQSLNSKDPLIKATVKELIHDPGRGAPIAEGRLDTGAIYYVVAPEGLAVGQEVELGELAKPAIGNVLPLGKINPGIFVSNIELSPGDGGKLVRSSGTYASVVSHTAEGTLVKLPSGKSMYLDDMCMATIGVVSGAGRTDKPFVKAGNKQFLMQARGRLYPIVKGIAMNPADHPHGGGSHKSKSLRPTTVSRNAPPGQKVGLIAARQSGRGRKKVRTM